MTDVDELVRCITALLALNERNVLVPHGVPGLARDCLKSAAAALERMRDERDEARSRFNDIDLCKMGQAPCASLLAAEAEVARLREALEELVDIVQDAIDQQSTKNMDSFTLQPARATLAQRSEK